MNKYVVKPIRIYSNDLHAGPKAKRDIDHYLNELDFQNINITVDDNKLKKFFFLKRNLKKQIDASEPGVIVFQYPLGSRYGSKLLASQIKKHPDLISICVVHDIESLRLRATDEQFKKFEIGFLNNFDYLIVHNLLMEQWLLENGITTKTVILSIFDYFNPQPIIRHSEAQVDVVYAGNLEKANFFQHLTDFKHQINLFGINPLPEYPANMSYQGSFEPDVLPSRLQAKFGLVWDGDSLDSCTGMWGEYMRYNNPHKISLYLSSGLPVIVWDQSAAASFITEKGLGIAISSLTELDDRLSQISEQEYFEMKARVVETAKLVRKGYFIKTAIKKIMRNENVGS